MSLETDLLLEAWNLKVAAFVLISVSGVFSKKAVPSVIIVSLALIVTEVEAAVVFQEDIFLRLVDVAQFPTLVLPAARMVLLACRVGVHSYACCSALFGPTSLVVIANDMKSE